VLSQRLGKQISTLRKLKGFTQEQLAEATDYSVEFMSLVERGINSPTVAGLERIATALGTEVKDLFDFNGEGDK